ncbi:ATP-binding protein [bacterium]|nr:ATP-binding protein [bacterium]
MRIAFSGTANSGKSTMVKSFLHTWTNYTTPEETYRKVIKEKGLVHSSKTTPETQTTILDFLVDQIQGKRVDDKIIYDRCPLDAVAYTMWANGKGIDGFTDEFVKNQITMSRESLRSLDIIFMTRFNEKYKVVDDGTRDVDVKFINEMDNIFYTLYMQYMTQMDADVFYPKSDSPCVILLPDDPQARIELIAEYVAPDGCMYGEEESILDPKNLSELEELVGLQKTELDREEKEKELFKQFGLKEGDTGRLRF